MAGVDIESGTRAGGMPLAPGTRESRLVLIFANPIAGRGRGAATARRLETALRQAGYAPECVFEKPSTARLPDGPVHAALSIGGDGTLRGVVAALTARAGGAGGPPPMMVIPSGTANLMGQSLKIDWSDADLERRVVETLRGYRLVPRDAAYANGQLFLIVAGAGLDGQIIHELERRRTGPINLLHYAIPSAISFKNWRYPRITVEVDGRHVFGPAPGMAMAGNVKEHGIGFSFLVDAVPDDGLLDVLVLPCRDFFEGIDHLLHALAGKLTEQEGVVFLRGKHCRITTATDSAGGIPVQADGDTAGFTPLEVRIADFQVPFLVPGE